MKKYSKTNPYVLTPSDELDDEQLEVLQEVVIGAYPEAVGETDGDGSWNLWPGKGVPYERFEQQIRWIESANRPNYQGINPNYGPEN